MHRDVVTHVTVTSTDFIITASQDGHIKFWKKLEVGLTLNTMGAESLVCAENLSIIYKSCKLYMGL